MWQQCMNCTIPNRRYMYMYLHVLQMTIKLMLFFTNVRSRPCFILPGMAFLSSVLASQQVGFFHHTTWAHNCYKCDYECWFREENKVLLSWRRKWAKQANQNASIRGSNLGALWLKSNEVRYSPGTVWFDNVANRNVSILLMFCCKLCFLAFLTTQLKSLFSKVKFWFTC